jgi:amino acid transporter
MAAGPVGVKHPAKIIFLLSLVMMALAWILSLIAIFVPWSWKNTAVFRRTYVNLWQNCVENTESPLNEYTCSENDLDQVGSVSGGSEKCRGYFVATQVFIIAGCVFAFLALLTAALILGKLWSKPVVLAIYLATMAFLAFGCIMISFLMWIVYAEQDCQPGNPLFPLEGYSWGWICAVCATFFAFLGMLLAYLGLYKILLFKPFIPHEEPPMYPVVMDAPVYMEPQPYYEPVAYEYPPVMAPSLAPAVAYPPVLAAY